MATVINTPPQEPPNGIGFLFGAVLLILFVLLLIFYVFPYFRSSVTQGPPQVNLPSHVDVNVKQSK